MRHVHKQQLTAVALAVALIGASAHAQTTPDSVQTRIGPLNFERGFPTDETRRKVFDEIDYQRAVQAYLWAYPAVSFESIRIAAKRDLGMERNGVRHRRQAGRFQVDLADGKRHHGLRLRERRSWESRPGRGRGAARAIVGLIDDFWQRAIVDLGLPGPDGDKGGKFLILPPRLQGRGPPPATTSSRATMNNYNIMVRGIAVKGDLQGSRAGGSQDAHLPLERGRQSQADQVRLHFGHEDRYLAAAGDRILGAALDGHQQQPGTRARPLLHGHAQAPGHRERQGVQTRRPAARDPRGRGPDRRRDGPGDAVRRARAHSAERQGDCRHELALGRGRALQPGGRQLQPARRTAALHLRRHLHVAGHRHQEGRPRVDLHPGLQGQGRQPPRRRQVIPPARARERAGSSLLVADAVRHRHPLHDPELEQRLGTLVATTSSRRTRMARSISTSGRRPLRTRGSTGSRRFPARASTRWSASIRRRRRCSTGPGSCRMSN